MARYPTFDLDVPDYLADTLHLTYREHGIYLMLMMQLWISPGQRFPNDDAWLCRKFRMTPEEVQNDLRPIVEEFCKCDGNWITQGRVTREFKRAEERSKKQSGRSKSGWKNRKEHSHGKAADQQTAMPEGAQSEASGNAPRARSTVTVTDTDRSKPNGLDGARTTKASRLPRDWALPDDWLAWAVAEGCTEDEAKRQAERFRDYWHAKSGKDATKADWQATWRNWIRKHLDDRPARPPPRNGRDAHPERWTSLDGMKLEGSVDLEPGETIEALRAKRDRIFRSGRQHRGNQH